MLVSKKHFAAAAVSEGTLPGPVRSSLRSSLRMRGKLLARLGSFALLTVAFALFSSSSSSSAAAPAGWTTVDQLLKGFGSSGAKAKRPNSSSITPFIDYDEMSQRALGRKEWDALSVNQRRDFSQSLQTLVEKRYYPRWRKIFSKGKVSFVEESSSGGDNLVKTRLLLGKKSETLAWRLSEKSNKVVSLCVGDKDLLERLKHRIQSKQKKSKGNIDVLIAWMRGASGEKEVASLDHASLAAGDNGAGVISD